METKPGIYTTEWWSTLFLHVLNLANLAGIWNFVPNKWSVMALAIIQGLYTASRGIAKSGVGADPTNPNNYTLTPKNTASNVRR